MSPLLSNYSFLSPLKRQRAVRARINNATPLSPPSKCANRLPVLPELSGEQDLPSCSSSVSSSTCVSRASPSPRHCRSNAPPSCPSSASSSTCSSRLSPPASASEKRRSRYGRDEFALDPDFLRNASSPTPTKQKHQTVRLSAFDIVIDITAPTSPISDVTPPAESSTTIMTTPPRPSRSRDLRLKSPPRSRSPTPSLTSMSACSSNSNDIPTTPLTSDDEWPGLSPSPQLRKAPSAQRVRIHPFAITTKSTAAPDSSSANVLEFTLADLEEQKSDEDEVSWYARELSEVVSLASSCKSSSSSATGSRPDSLFPPPKMGPRSRMSKPLPAIPHTPGPHPQLDPTFPRRRTASRPGHLLRQPLPPPPSDTVTTTNPAIRKSLKITVPRAPPRTPLPLDVADIFDDIDAWSIFVPSAGLRSTSTGTANTLGCTELSPPRLPQTPMSAYSEYDPVELIVDYAKLPSPSPSPSLSSFLPEYDEDEEECWPTEEKLSSRWSCSTVATLAKPSSPSASEKLRFHLGSVARRMRACKATHARSSSEPSANPVADGDGADASVRSESGHDDELEADAESPLRRKPIPLELFLRS
ncbi:hypothetical protein EI94DRAFT_1723475 [Lactarius quietus]|nr:hypothetical protein EI94DRAFT_1723475 [Lactarius quietus]